jgi:hypothetical protein
MSDIIIAAEKLSKRYCLRTTLIAFVRWIFYD